MRRLLLRLQNRRRAHVDDGFTLIELMVAMGIMMLILVVIAVTFNFGIKSTRNSAVRNANLQTARVAVDRMSKALRMAVIPKPGMNAFEAGTPTDVTFYAAINDVSSGPSGPTKFRYSVSNGTLTEQVTPVALTGSGTSRTFDWPPASTVTKVLARGLSNPPPNPVFTYLADTDVTASSLGGTLTSDTAPDVDQVELWVSVDNVANPDVPPTTVNDRVACPNHGTQYILF